MTARKALDRLALAGDIVRRHGSGSFVADDSVRSSFLVIRNIADEIGESGRRYSSRMLRQCSISCDTEVAAVLELAPEATVYHSLIVHLADEEAAGISVRSFRCGASVSRN